jgi:hypothetical protein
MTFIIIYGIGVLAALIHLARSKDRSTHNILTIALVYFFLCLGLNGIWGFITNLGLPAENLFQLETAIANLGLGVLGIMCMFFRKQFWLATLVMYTIFAWGSAYGNIAQSNFSVVLYLDIIMPLIGIGLFIAHKITKPEVKAMFSLMKDVQDMLKKTGLNINL